MTSVILRRVRTALETKSRMPGGVSVTLAIAGAETALKTLAPEAARKVEDGVVRLAALAHPESQRPTAERLEEMERLADAMLGYCAVLDCPELAECLKSLSYLVQAVAGSDLWVSGTFGPSLSIVRLTARASLAPHEIKVLIDAVARCTNHYQPAAAPLSAPGATCHADKLDPGAAV